MSDLYQVTETISVFKAVLWIFYPMAALVLIELLLRTNDDDDDDFQGGKGLRVEQMQPAYAPSGA